MLPILPRNPMVILLPIFRQPAKAQVRRMAQEYEKHAQRQPPRLPLSSLGICAGGPLSSRLRDAEMGHPTSHDARAPSST
ncbi:hypothetical protein ACRALDRAFT_209828 [Sodiomyces alcalophilus JCM 7366]|uniref:uncharacterized protein n=1 Tax=Sodiomyces alcalophilus JCM 7366 TaxID=591952 RepID=UPI0039B3B505